MSGPPNKSAPNTPFDGHNENGLDALTAQTDFLAEWGEPDWTILDDRRGTLPEFPADALLGQVRDYIDRASVGAGVTFAHVAVPLLSIASGILGTARRIQASRSGPNRYQSGVRW